MRKCDERMREIGGERERGREREGGRKRERERERERKERGRGELCSTKLNQLVLGVLPKSEEEKKQQWGKGRQVPRKEEKGRVRYEWREIEREIDREREYRKLTHSLAERKNVSKTN